MNPLKYKSNYDKYPVVQLPDDYIKDCFPGWNAILSEIASKLQQKVGKKNILVIECYPGVFEKEIEDNFLSKFPDVLILNSSSAMLCEDKLNALLKEDITDDEIFGYMTRRNIDCYFDTIKVEALRSQIKEAKNDLIIIFGTGAAYIQPESDILMYADMARWEIQMRFRRNELGNIGVNNKDERASLKYKRAFFVDWRICDRFKKKLMPKWDYVLDTNIKNEPKMATAKAIRAGLKQAASQPFRVVPFFDPGPWGGQWMKEVCDLDRDQKNFAWCFDCVPEENSLLLGFGDVKFELPSIDLVFAHPCDLLGKPVHARFGDEFPIRFDFLDTMDGGNLSLQVHPLTEYIQEKFGMHYTQEESYYMLDAREDAVVYLGLKNGIDKDKMISELEDSQTTGKFDADKYIGKYPVKKHDHILIPPGTIHCSGINGMVLEISATPFIFTFKLWDWARLGLDGRPRPINIEHGKNVIQWNRDENWVKNEGINQIVKVAEGDGWHEEKTGLHECEFIETRRHWFSKTVPHKTNGSVNVLNLVEGREAIVESPTNAFEPFVVHYAETFIIPEAVKEYTIRPFGESEGKECATLKAYVRHNG
ncbi:mannose-6-phosphate isomerase class I [Dysgonomonas hofstadii]|uniref:Mannose-6-phosphate isomerase class I n=1 Tax=Dysgonomonas hofstadii TaxID=637886 RepID=A0A840CEM5_9BACT|nr:class I mannose-6-phosphate isomerase [Dysgonomonas hofstadii]MBB4034400.1 mannose-6-phosphate isomerase class I [Dysgonomonas hofstadii]